MSGLPPESQRTAARPETAALEVSHADPSGNRLVHQLVAERAAADPEALAVTDAGGSLTYGELDRQANRLASRLRALGVGPEVLVGLCLPRSRELMVAALGILKSGGAYLAMDPAYPVERLKFMLEDSGTPVLVTGQGQAARLPAGPWQVLAIDADPDPLAAEGDAPPVVGSFPEDLAYVIYTSGSTGRPKGVQVTHANLLNLVAWHRRAFGVTAEDRATQVASPSFDAVVWETWPYLTAGASLHVPDETTRAAAPALRDWLVARRITISFLPTPVAEAVVALDWPSETSLRLLLTGGDVLHRHPAAGLPFTLVNNYGPTEATVVTTSGVVPPGESGRLPSIGRPIDNVSVHVLVAELRPVPAGQAGELCVGGAGVARGYLNRPELTEERFVPATWSGRPGERLYRTGDLVRRREDGEIDFMSRLDDQVKVRGFRIEPHEITAILDAHPEVRSSAVVARDDGRGDKRLVAYVVPSAGASMDPERLRAHLGERLPEHMLPAVFVAIEELPLTPNGKVDREALPEPLVEVPGGEEELLSPRTQVEQVLAEILSGLLGVERVGVDQNFFILGGHSLLGAQLIVRIRDRFGVEISLRTLFDHPTVEAMAAAVEDKLVEQLESLSEEEATRQLAGLPVAGD